MRWWIFNTIIDLFECSANQAGEVSCPPANGSETDRPRDGRLYQKCQVWFIPNHLKLKRMSYKTKTKLIYSTHKLKCTKFFD